MKHLITAFCLAIAGAATAQTSMQGAWQGTLKGAIELKVVLHLKEANGQLEAKMDSPDQGVTDIPGSNPVRNGDSIRVSFMGGRAEYRGHLVNDTILRGSWHQGIVVPLVLVKTSNPATIKRSQTPVAPFPYNSEDLSFYNADKSIRFGATFTYPRNLQHPVATVLLITGSGPHNRDEELYGHKPFAVLADYLTRKGYAVLRVDDRGVGASTGNRVGSTTLDYALDAEAALDFLKTRKETDAKKIGLIGHSEGGLIAEVVASRRKDVSFVVLLAAPGVPIIDLMTEQSNALLRSQKVKEEYISRYAPLYRSVVQAVLQSKDSAEAMRKGGELVYEWRMKDPETALALDMTTAEEQNEFVAEYIKQLSDPWFRRFFAMDPAPYLKKIKGKVLALNGEKDIQVAPANLEGIRQNLTSKAQAEIKLLPGLNHLFQTCKLCTLDEYRQLDESFSPVALSAIGDWMDKHIKP